MLEVLFYTEKLFAPSGALACSPLPGSSAPGKSDSGSCRPGVSQADGLRADGPCTGVSVLRAEPSTRRAFYAPCIRRGAWRQGQPTLHAARPSRAA
jgi:hypothetical protein